MSSTSNINTFTKKTSTNNPILIMVITLRLHFRTFLQALLVLLISIQRIESFQLGPKIVQNDTPTFRFPSNRDRILIKSSEQQKALSTPTSFYSASPSSTEINAKKKKIAEEEPERKKNNAFELVLLFMTPWRNPNSIFVYLFGTVYFLGKYSEAQSIAAAAAGSGGL